MTLEQALALQEGSIIVSKHDDPPFRPRRVTHVDVNGERTIVHVIIASFGREWIRADGFELAPEGKQWNQETAAWESVA
jgi:hypothetical protein